MKRITILALTVVLLLAAAGAALFMAKHRSAGKAPAPILMLGMDALEWQVVDPLREAGRLPNFDRVIREGVRANMRTLVPLTESPAIWTTIATGRYPESHGVGGFLRGGGAESPVTSDSRRVKAIWNILSSAGIDVGVVGWLVTWPCEAVRGFMVSDYLQYEFDQVARSSGRTYPPELYDQIAPLVLSKRQMNADSLRWLVDLESADFENPSIMEGLELLKWIYAADQTFTRVGLKLWKEKHPPFMAVYFRGPDAVSHAFWYDRHMQGVPYHGRPQFARVIEAYYEYMDRVLGQFLKESGPEVNLIILSDHGYKGSTTLEDGTVVLGVGAHRELGVLIARGPAFRRGADAGQVKVEDVTPSLLHMEGLPLGRDMDGEPMWGIFPPDEARRHPSRFIPTYETGEKTARPAVESSPVDKELIDRLKSLGYLR